MNREHISLSLSAPLSLFQAFMRFYHFPLFYLASFFLFYIFVHWISV